MKNRRATIFDLPIIVLLIFIVVLLAIFGTFVLGEFSTAINETGVGNVSYIVPAQNALLNLDNMLIVMVVGLLLVTIGGAFYIDTHPVFFVAGFIVLIITVVLSAMFTNVFQDIATSPQLINSSNEFTFGVHIMHTLPIIVLIGGALILIVMYGKSRGWGG